MPSQNRGHLIGQDDLQHGPSRRRGAKSTIVERLKPRALL